MKQLNSVLTGVNAVEGLDPTSLLEQIQTTDATGAPSTKSIIRTTTQLSWFRCVYPKGRIAVTVREVTTHDGLRAYEATAEVYADAADPVGQYLANATALRAFDPTMPSISPMEWAQTAAIGIALRNAGFGCQLESDLTGANPQDFNTGSAIGNQLDPMCGIPQYDVSQYGAPQSEFFSSPNPMPNVPTASAQMPTYRPVPQRPVQQQPQAEPQIKQQASANPVPHAMNVQQAYDMLCPFPKHRGKTMLQVLQTEPGFVNWVAGNHFDDPQKAAFSAAAKVVCEYAVQQQG